MDSTAVAEAFAGQVTFGLGGGAGTAVLRPLTAVLDAPLTGRSCERAAGAWELATAGVSGTACSRVASTVPLTSTAMRAVPRPRPRLRRMGKLT